MGNFNNAFILQEITGEQRRYELLQRPSECGRRLRRKKKKSARPNQKPPVGKPKIKPHGRPSTSGKDRLVKEEPRGRDYLHTYFLFSILLPFWANSTTWYTRNNQSTDDCLLLCHLVTIKEKSGDQPVFLLEKDATEEEINAATTIQAVYKGYRARTKLVCLPFNYLNFSLSESEQWPLSVTFYLQNSCVLCQQHINGIIMYIGRWIQFQKQLLLFKMTMADRPSNFFQNRATKHTEKFCVQGSRIPFSITV